MSAGRRNTPVRASDRRALFAKLLLEAGVGSRDGAIPRRNDSRPTLSLGEQQLWFSHQLAPVGHRYHIWDVVRVRGQLDVSALERALGEIVSRHETLRTCFREVDGRVVKLVGSEPSRRRIQLPIDDLRAVPSPDREMQALRRAAEELRRPFDLTRPLWRTSLIALADDEHLLLWCTHHIVNDGWSRAIFARELAALYEAFAAGRPSPLADLRIQYGDYAAWEREWLESEDARAQLDYWKRQLRGSSALPPLPTDRPRTAATTTRGARELMHFPHGLVEELKQLSRREGTTLFMVLLAAFQVLLWQHTKRDDIVVGTDTANRSRLDTEDLIGFFVNHVVLRTDLSGNPTLRELLGRVREVALGAYAHQDLPFVKVVEAVGGKRHPGVTPLFQALFVLQNLPAETLRLPGLDVTPVDIDGEVSKFDLSLFVEESPAGLTGMWLYKTDLYDATTIRRLALHYERLVESIVARPDARLNSTLTIPTDADRRQHSMEQTHGHGTPLKNLRGIRRKAVDLTQATTVETEYLPGAERAPLVLKPGTDGLDLAEWAGANVEYLERELLGHGAILFRGFDVGSPADFERVSEAICPELFDEYGDLPRDGVSGKIYSSTPYPSDQPILFHNESSHLHRWPLKIWFYCVTPAQEGGETPFVDCRQTYRELDSAIRDRFTDKGVMYVRNYTEGLDVSWRTFFGTEDRAEVEAALRNAAIEFEWKDGDGLGTREVRRAVATHPKTKDRVFFNQVQLHHPACLPDGVRESLLSMLPEEDLPRNCHYGDGSRIEDSVMEEINALYQATAVGFPWQQGDILMVDNMLAAHSRNPFVGPRKIVVALGEMVDEKDA